VGMPNNRVVEIVIPNHTDADTDAVLVLEPVDPTAIPGLELEPGELEVLAAGITADLCADVDQEFERALRVTVPAHSEIAVRVVVRTDDRTTGTVGFALTDERDGIVVGGVTIVCSNPLYTDTAPSVPPRNPCPLDLVTPLHIVYPDTDPSTPLETPGIILKGGIFDLVAWVRNTTNVPIDNTTLYVEHLGVSGIEIEPRIWHIGTVEPADEFRATWRINSYTSRPAPYEFSLVAESANFDPVRIHTQVVVSENRG
jgi:hypothetical protein